MDENEIAYRGLIIRHLILPEGLAGSGRSLRWIARESLTGGHFERDVTVFPLSQSCPISGDQPPDHAMTNTQGGGSDGRTGDGKRLAAGNGRSGQLPAGL